MARFVRIAMGSASELDHHFIALRGSGFLAGRTLQKEREESNQNPKDAGSVA
jgi:hypothetical protein